MSTTEADVQPTGDLAPGERALDTVPNGAPEPEQAPEAIVAIAASAGGLEAIERFFGVVETPSRFAFVIVQHLSPDLKSLMGELLSRRATLAVPQVVNGMRPVANAIYLIPPGKTMTVEGGALLLADRDAKDFAYHPIDEFFLSLAADQGAASIGVVLSGSGSDGSRGARAILRAGGRVLVQAPATAKFSSMPKAALEAGCTADVMPPEAMPRALLDVDLRSRQEERPRADGSLPEPFVETLEATFGIDLSRYRAGVVLRRVRRRMMLRGFDQIADYAELVANDADEQEALYQDLLIGGTAFFRDPEVFGAFERLVVPALAAELDAGREVRIWVPAVATGEEAYSIAIMLLARCKGACADPASEPPLRIFATDVHRRSLAVAAAGYYSEEVVRNVRPEWLERYFSRRGSGYQVIPALRRSVAFSSHDLLQDPPLTRLQFVSCRNLLLCLETAAQDDVLRRLAGALQADGYLLLGTSESPGTLETDFETVAGGLPLYRRRSGSTPLGRPALVSSVLAAGAQAGEQSVSLPPGGLARPERRDRRLTMAHELLLDRYVPPSLLVDAAGLVVHCFGDAGAYLRQPRGRPSLAVLEMIVEPLRGPLGTAMSRVRRTGRPVKLRHLAAGEGHVLQRLVVEMLPAPGDSPRCLLISFDDREAAVETVESAPSNKPEALAAARTQMALLLEALPQPAALADGTGRLTAANIPMEEAAMTAGLAPDLVGRELSWLLAPFLDAAILEELGRRLAEDEEWRHREVTAAGATLSVELRSSDGQGVALVLLEPPSETAVAPPAACC